MIDHEELLEIFKADLIAANLDPVRHLAKRKRRCKECTLLYQAKGKKHYHCKSEHVSGYLTGGEFACREFKAKI